MAIHFLICGKGFRECFRIYLSPRLLGGAGLWGRAVLRSLRRSGESGRVGGQLAQSTVAATIFMSRRQPFIDLRTIRADDKR